MREQMTSINWKVYCDTHSSPCSLHLTQLIHIQVRLTYSLKSSMYMSDATHGNISTAISAQSVGIFKMKWSYNEYTNTSLQILQVSDDMACSFFYIRTSSMRGLIATKELSNHSRSFGSDLVFFSFNNVRYNFIFKF